MPHCATPLEKIESDIKPGWIEEQLVESRRQTLDAMRTRYGVVRPNAPTIDGMMTNMQRQRERHE
jgi:hypothetical protein